MSSRMSQVVMLACSGTLAAAAVAQTVVKPSAPAPAPATSSAKSAVTSAASADATLFEAACSGCHELAQATAAPMDEAGWRDTVARMVGYGAQVTPEQAERITRYLTATHGPAAAK
jgi:cytochrome c5